MAAELKEDLEIQQGSLSVLVCCISSSSEAGTAKWGVSNLIQQV